jgi:hypothetical protein
MKMVVIITTKFNMRGELLVLPIAGNTVGMATHDFRHLGTYEIFESVLSREGLKL